MHMRTRIAAFAISLGLAATPLVSCGGSGTTSQGSQAASTSETSSMSSTTTGTSPSATSSISSQTSTGLTMKDAFEPNSELKHRPFTVTIPNYFGQPTISNNGNYFAYNISDSSAIMTITFLSSSKANDTDPKAIATLGVAIVEGSVEGIKATVDSQQDTDINGLKSNVTTGWLADDQDQRVPFCTVGIVSSDGKDVAVLTMIEGGKDGFDYSADFAKVCSSVHYDEAQASTGNTTQAEPQEQEAAPEEASDEISTEFKATMDSYEAFFDEYVDFMRRYKENPTDMELLSEASDMLSREADMIREFDNIEHEDLNSAEMAYYLEVQARIYKKLAEAI